MITPGLNLESAVTVSRGQFCDPREAVYAPSVHLLGTVCHKPRVTLHLEDDLQPIMLLTRFLWINSVFREMYRKLGEGGQFSNIKKKIKNNF